MTSPYSSYDEEDDEDGLEVQFIVYTDRFGIDYETAVMDYIRIGTQEFHNSEINNELE